MDVKRWMFRRFAIPWPASLVHCSQRTNRIESVVRHQSIGLVGLKSTVALDRFSCHQTTLTSRPPNFRPTATYTAIPRTQPESVCAWSLTVRSFVRSFKGALEYLLFIVQHRGMVDGFRRLVRGDPDEELARRCLLTTATTSLAASQLQLARSQLTQMA